MAWREDLRTRARDGGTGSPVVSLSAYLASVERALEVHDFALERTFAAVSVCRDELTQSLLGEVGRRWDHPFALGGLGGLPSLGRTGWGACLSHVPHRGGRGHLLVFGFPHIGVTPDGQLGQSLRRHQDQPTSTCGALAALFATYGSVPTQDPAEPLADAEALRLRRLVSAELSEAPADLVELTLATARAVECEMWAELDALAPWAEMDVAVMIGVQIHVPDDEDHILPVTAAIRTQRDPVPRPLELS